jgi:type IV secretion system protein TrbB
VSEGGRLGLARRLDALRHALGPEIAAALADAQVTEVMVNPDGRIWVDRLGEGRSSLGASVSREARDRVIRLVADHAGEAVGRDAPRLSGTLPTTGERFQGVLPPLAMAPAFSIRKPADRIWTLADYVADGAMTEIQATGLRRAVEERRNILVSGGTGSGKTTLANALLAEPGFARDRLVLIEDTRELQPSAPDAVSLLTRPADPAIGVADLVRDALRLRPDRIVVGEVRDGAAALETLKAWNTGHPGGLCTLHANTAGDALRRLEDLILEVAPEPPRRSIGAAVDLIVQMTRTKVGRRVEGLVAVAGHEEGRYLTRDL